MGGANEKPHLEIDNKGQGVIITYKGLSEVESRALKDAAIKEWEQASKAFGDLVAKQEKELKDQGKSLDDWEKDPAMKAARDAAQKKLNDAADKKNEDPNKSAGGVVRPSGQQSACEAGLQRARELLRECNRTGWRLAACQSLAARMNRCPDPSYIYVDPDSGYACGQKPDEAAVLDAWRQY